jgi:pSer/pThr/pTyr-binding forkhead associated (FHA) protein
VLGPAVGAPVRGSVVALLLGVDGALDGHVVRVFEGENVLGREGSPEPLPNRPDTKTISRQHARLRADGGDFMIEAVRPENATFVNEQLVESPQLLQHGDRIRLGATKPTTFVLLVVP